MLLPFEEVFVFEGRSQNYRYRCMQSPLRKVQVAFGFRTVCVGYQWQGIVKVRWHCQFMNYYFTICERQCYLDKAFPLMYVLVLSMWWEAFGNVTCDL